MRILLIIFFFILFTGSLLANKLDSLFTNLEISRIDIIDFNNNSSKGSSLVDKDIIRITVPGLDILVDSGYIDCSKIKVYFNRYPVNGLYCEWDKMSKNLYIPFNLREITRNSIQLLDSIPDRFNKAFQISLALPIGKDENVRKIKYASTINLNLPNRKLGYAASFLISFLLFLLFLRLISSTNLLRGQIPEKLLVKDENDNPIQTPYSLARTQLAFWTFVIFISFLFIYITKGEFNSINSTALILLGISSTTAGASILIDKGEEKKEMEEEEKDKKPFIYKPSQGLITDIISDKNGVSIHRLQNVAFNLIYGAIFLITVYQTQQMPVFDENQWILLGISAGAYTGLKVTEKRSDKKED